MNHPKPAAPLWCESIIGAGHACRLRAPNPSQIRRYRAGATASANAHMKPSGTGGAVDGLLRGVERVDPTLEAAALAGHECRFSECLGKHGGPLVAGDELDGEITGVAAAH
jgi:hypothetical protein